MPSQDFSVDSSPCPGVRSFKTDDVDDASREMAKMFGPSARVVPLRDREPFAFRYQAATLGEMTLTKADVANWKMLRSTEGRVNITVPLEGVLNFNCGRGCEPLAPNRTAGVARSFDTLAIQVERGGGISLGVPEKALIERAERLTGKSFGDALASRLVARVDLESPMGKALCRNMKAALSEISGLNAFGMGMLAASAYEDMLLNLAVVALYPAIGGAVGSSPADCGPVVVRRARDYIRAHAHEPIELSKLAAQLNITMRALQDKFQRSYGFSPRDYILECRLERARDRLFTPDGSISVTEIALESGFADLSHFAAKYRDKYGELPSETLRMSRDRRD